MSFVGSDCSMGEAGSVECEVYYSPSDQGQKMPINPLFFLKAASQQLQDSELFYRPADLWVALFDEELIN